MIGRNPFIPLLGFSAPMHLDYRNAQTAVLAKLDCMEAEANGILAGPADTDMVAQAEELRELIIEMSAKVEGNLEQ